MGQGARILDRMKNLSLLSLLGLSLLLPAVHGFFLGPVAVGVALGALFVTKGLFLGALLSSKRTHRQSYRTSRNYHYRPSNHYNTRYNSRYTKTPTYYYSSEKYSRSYGKREAMAVDQNTLARFRREIQDRSTREPGTWRWWRRIRTTVPKDSSVRWQPGMPVVPWWGWRLTWLRHSASATPSTCPATRRCSTWPRSRGS